MKDEIIDEVRRIRERYVAKHGHDLNVVYADLKRRESASRRRRVDLAAERQKQHQGHARTAVEVGAPQRKESERR